MDFNFEQGELILVDKPYRWSSFDVVNNIRAVLRKKTGKKKFKIGHAGTLDPLATGLLVLCTGIYTKRIEEFKEYDKEYTGTFTLGATTPSFDLETEVDQAFDTAGITEEAIMAAARKFTGSFDQIPPAFSAVKFQGKRAYKFARKDIDVELKSKQVVISAFEITGIELPLVHFRIICSKGTYIRAIARDLGLELSNGAHLSSLCRIRIGPYHLRDAYQVEMLREAILSQE
jgi:tRNA pseudouridine55 synthase